VYELPLNVGQRISSLPMVNALGEMKLAGVSNGMVVADELILAESVVMALFEATSKLLSVAIPAGKTAVFGFWAAASAVNNSRQAASLDMGVLGFTKRVK
jgi:hypothetical protein